MVVHEQPGKHAGELPSPAFVRSFTLTRGRTVPQVDLPFEATLAVSPDAAQRAWPAGLAGEVVRLCHGRSVAEVAAEVRQPIGVVRVVIADLVVDGHVTVQRTLVDASFEERRDLLQRTLRGLLVS